jgi:hypothetical protein
VIYLNKLRIENSEMFFWEKGDLLGAFIKKYGYIITDNENKFVIKQLNKDQFDTIRSMILFPLEFQGKLNEGFNPRGLYFHEYK